MDFGTKEADEKAEGVWKNMLRHIFEKIRRKIPKAEHEERRGWAVHDVMLFCIGSEVEMPRLGLR